MANRSSLFIVTWMLVIHMTASSLLAEKPSSTTPVCVLDIQRIINESIIGKAARNNVESEVKKSEVKLEPLRAELTKLRADSNKQSALLSSGAIEERQELLAKKEKEFARAIEDSKADLAKKNEAELGKVVKQIDEVVRDLAAEGKYGFVLERDSRLVLYVKPDLDLTDQVIKLLDNNKIGL